MSSVTDQAANASTADASLLSEGERVVVLTGATAGIGRALLEELLRRIETFSSVDAQHNVFRHTILLPVRDIERARARMPPSLATTSAAGPDVELHAHYESTSIRVILIRCDLSLMAGVRSCCDRILARVQRINALVLNAGMTLPFRAREPIMTPEGLEMTAAVNFYAPVLMTQLLRRAISHAGGSIVVVGSRSHARAAVREPVSEASAEVALVPPSFTGFAAYARSKFALTAWAHALARIRELDIVVVHPGRVLATEFVRRMPLLIAMRPIAPCILCCMRFSTPEQSARHLADATCMWLPGHIQRPRVEDGAPYYEVSYAPPVQSTTYLQCSTYVQVVGATMRSARSHPATYSLELGNALVQRTQQQLQRWLPPSTSQESAASPSASAS